MEVPDGSSAYGSGIVTAVAQATVRTWVSSLALEPLHDTDLAKKKKKKDDLLGMVVLPATHSSINSPIKLELSLKIYENHYKNNS